MIAERRDQPGLHQRRLAGSRGSDDGQEGMQAKPLPQLLELLVAPEEAVAVLLGEGRHADIGAGGPRPPPRLDRVAQDLAELLDLPGPLGRVGPVQTLQHGQSGRWGDLAQLERDHRPGGGLEPVGLGEQVDELARPVGEIRGRQHDQGVLALAHRALHLVQQRGAKGEVPLVVVAHIGLVEGRQQEALDPAAVRLRVGDEDVIATRHRVRAAARWPGVPGWPRSRRRRSCRATAEPASGGAACRARA